MPKIIPGLRETILDTAQRLLFEGGYQALTVRRVAAECGIAAGTFYNYYSSKDELVAHIMLRDWNQMLREMSVSAAACSEVSDGLRGLLEILSGYVGKYREIWSQSVSSAGASVGGYAVRYHGRLIEQLCECVDILLKSCARGDLAALSSLLAEVILASSLHETITAQQMEILADMLTEPEHLHTSSA